MNPNNQLFKGSLSIIILRLLGEEPKMYGYEITRKVKELSDGNILITEGALYPSLHKLEADGFIESSIEQVDNRNRKYYSLTKTGRKESKAKLEELTSFIEQIQTLLNLTPSTISKSR